MDYVKESLRLHDEWKGKPEMLSRAACAANHRFTTIGVPACFFAEAGEARHERSYEAMLRGIQENRAQISLRL